jgi:type IX secretion system PorP/SprF family membrane protein
MINPAATGSDDFLNISLGGRMQWAGFDNSPRTSYLYFSAPANKWKGAFMKRTFGKVKRNNKQVRHPRVRRGSVVHAFGGNVRADQFGAFRNLSFAGSYAVHMPLSNEYKLSFGTSVGLSSRSFLEDRAQTLTQMTGTGIDPVYNNMIAGNGAQNMMDVSAGLYFYGDDAFAGVSVNQLTKDFVKFGNPNLVLEPRMHMFASAGYRFHLNNRVTLTPAMLVKYVKAAPVSVEGSVQMEFNDLFWFGFSYRHQDAVVGMVGATISEVFRIGYSYDLSISRMINYNSGGHEVVLSFLIGNTTSTAARFN